MTALAANKVPAFKRPGTIRRYPMAASTTIWAGGLVCLNASGLAVPAAATAGFSQVLGVACAKVVSDGVTQSYVQCEEGDFQFAATSLTQAMLGRPLYVVDDNNVDDRATTKVFAGRLVEFVSTTSGIFSVGTSVPKPHFKSHVFPVTLSLIANGDVVTNFTPGYAGRISAFQWVQEAAVTTAAKAATFNLEIGNPGTDVTGGVLALTSANATPLGKVIAATAITALDEFTAADVISIEASAVTAFIEGSGSLHILTEEY